MLKGDSWKEVMENVKTRVKKYYKTDLKHIVFDISPLNDQHELPGNRSFPSQTKQNKNVSLSSRVMLT